jgi:hypothetical protein
MVLDESSGAIRGIVGESLAATTERLKGLDVDSVSTSSSNRARSELIAQRGGHGGLDSE